MSLNSLEMGCVRCGAPAHAPFPGLFPPFLGEGGEGDGVRDSLTFYYSCVNLFYDLWMRAEPYSLSGIESVGKFFRGGALAKNDLSCSHPYLHINTTNFLLEEKQCHGTNCSSW